MGRINPQTSLYLACGPEFPCVSSEREGEIASLNFLAINMFLQITVTNNLQIAVTNNLQITVCEIKSIERYLLLNDLMKEMSYYF